MIGEFGVRRALFPAGGVSELVDPLAVQRALNETGVLRLYPGFNEWFFHKVIPGLRTGERRVLTSVVSGALSGVAICKRTDIESKLCTLWVSKQARGRGIASELAAEAFCWLGTSKPLFTVPEEHLADFGGLLRSWSFSQPIAYRELYIPKRVEHVFNGRIGDVAH
jgi:GNAT superfamily N-acetyltransferase